MSDGCDNFVRGRQWLSGAGVALCALAGMLGGCKGNSTSAATVVRSVGKPPFIFAYPAGENARDADPLTSPIWQAGVWSTFTAPINTVRTTPDTQAKVLFDAATLYVAFVSQQEPQVSQSDPARDQVILFLDNGAAAPGLELLQISLDSTAKSPEATWFRAALPAQPRDDGTPDIGHPVNSIPKVSIPGMTAQVRQGAKDGRPVWTAVLAVPIQSLPQPFKTLPQPGQHWKINLVRILSPGMGRKLQSNFSPIYIGAQPVSPYRLADLQIGEK